MIASPVFAESELPAAPETPPIDLNSMSVDELLELRLCIDQVLEAKDYQVYGDLERSDTGEAVIRLQEKLFALGYYSGSISGKFDSETQKAMKSFEKNNGLKNDGQASREDQALLFSDNAIPKQTAVPEAQSSPTPTPDPMAEVYAQYGSFDYTELMRFPEEYFGDKVKLQGNVEQVMGSRQSGFKLRLSTARGEDIFYIVVNEDPGYNILEGDSLIVYASMIGTFTYESTWKVEVTIPYASADYLVLK